MAIELLDLKLSIATPSITVVQQPQDGVVTCSGVDGISYMPFGTSVDEFQVEATATFGPVLITFRVDGGSGEFLAAYEGSMFDDDDPSLLVATVGGAVQGVASLHTDGISRVFGEVTDSWLGFPAATQRGMHLIDGAESMDDVTMVLEMYDTDTVAGAIYIPSDLIVQRERPPGSRYVLCSRRQGWLLEFITGCAAGAVTGGAITGALGPGILVGAVAGCVVGGTGAVVFDPDPNDYNPVNSTVIGVVGGAAAGVAIVSWPTGGGGAPPVGGDPAALRFISKLEKVFNRGGGIPRRPPGI